jgi:tetratricopeptide (TPR) repeat protein
MPSESHFHLDDKQADSVCESLCNALRQVPVSEEDKARLEVYMRLATARYKRKEFQEAYTSLLEIMKIIATDDDLTKDNALHYSAIAGIKKMLGLVLCSLDNLVESEIYFSTAFKIQWLLMGTHMQSADTLHCLISVLRGTGQEDEAEPMVCMLISMYESLEKPNLEIYAHMELCEILKNAKKKKEFKKELHALQLKHYAALKLVPDDRQESTESGFQGWQQSLSSNHRNRQTERDQRVGLALYS